jgi:hypothetical protein
MVDAGSVKGEFIIDDSSYKKATNNAVSTSKKVEKSFGGMTKSLFTAQLAYNAFAKVLDFGKKKFVDSIKNARDLGEETNKFKVVFKGVVPQAIKMRDELVKAYGMSRLESTRAMAAFQDFLVPMGVVREEASKMSGDFVKLAVDIGSFNNAPTAQVLEAIKSGIAGMSRPMRQFGVDISETTLKEMALAQGIEIVGDKLDSQTRAQLIYQKILKDSSDASGDFGRTSQDLANRQKKLSSLFVDISSNLGERLLPLLNNGAGAAIKLASSFDRMTRVKLSDELQKEQVELNALVSVITDVNTPTERRASLLVKLNNEYPSFLGNLDKEKATNRELTDRLKEVNDAYINRIIIQKEQENIEKITQKVADKKRQALNVELDLRKELAKEAIKNGIELTGSIEDQIKAIDEPYKSQNKFTGTIYDSNLAMQDESGSAIKLQSLYDKYNKLIAQSNEKTGDLTEAQERKKQILDGLNISEEKLIDLTTKGNAKEAKKNELKNKDIELTAKQKEEYQKLRDEFADTQKSEIQIAQDAIKEKAALFLKAGVNQIAVESWTAEEIKKIQNNEYKEYQELQEKQNDESLKDKIAHLNEIKQAAIKGGEDEKEVTKAVTSEIQKMYIEAFQKISGVVQYFIGNISSAYQGIADVVNMFYENDYNQLFASNEAKLEELTNSKEEQLEVIQTDYEKQQEDLQASYDAGLISEAEYNEQKDILDKQKAEKEAQVNKDMDSKIAEQKSENLKKQNAEKKKQFEANKANQIAMAWINFATGAISAYVGAFQALGWMPVVGPALALAMGSVMTALLLGTTVAQTIAISQQQFVPEKATGGSVEAGTTYSVNEYGQEMFTPGVNGYISPASVTSQITKNVESQSSNNKGMTNIINFDGAVFSNQMDLESIANYVIDLLGRKLELA